MRVGTARTAPSRCVDTLSPICCNVCCCPGAVSILPSRSFKLLRYCLPFARCSSLHVTTPPPFGFPSCYCSQTIDPCTPPSLCLNGAKCKDDKCICKPGWAGIACEKESSCVAQNRCSGHGKCVSGSCVCDAGTTRCSRHCQRRQLFVASTIIFVIFTNVVINATLSSSSSSSPPSSSHHHQHITLAAPYSRHLYSMPP